MISIVRFIYRHVRFHWTDLFMHDVEITQIPELEWSMCGEGVCPRKVGVEEVTRYIQVLIAWTQADNISVSPARRGTKWKPNQIYSFNKRYQQDTNFFSYSNLINETRYSPVKHTVNFKITLRNITFLFDIIICSILMINIHNQGN